MPLGARLIVFILLAAVPIFVVQLLHELEQRRSHADLILRRAEGLANLAAARQDRLVEGARLMMTAASRLQSIREKNSTVCRERLREIESRVSELAGLAVVTPEGERWCSSNPEEAPATNLADRTFFQNALRTGEVQTSGYVPAGQTREGRVIFAYPVKNAAGRVEVVLLATYRTTMLSGLLAEPGLTPGVVMALADHNSLITARWPEPDQWMGEIFPDAELLARAYERGRGVERVQAAWAGPEEYAVAYAPVQAPARLIVLAALPLTAALREAERTFWREVGWTTAIFVLAALIAIIGARLTVVRPIRDLQDFADQLSTGDLRARPPESRGSAKELRALARHIGLMAAALEQRQSQLVEAMAQKDMLLKEVNHRVKNSLQLVASLLGLQRAQIRDPEARRQFEEAGRRINTVAAIHQRLYQDEHVDRVALDRFLVDLCTDLAKVYGEGRVTVTCNAEPCHLETERIIPVALIINELIANAFKYSFPNESRGVIHVDCREEQDSIVLSVSDDGAALPEAFDPEKSQGLGMKMIAALSRQLRAKLDVTPHNRGKVFTVRVPREGSDAA